MSSIHTESELDEIFDRLFTIMTSEKFLRSEGLGKEVPLYIQPYAIERQSGIEKRIRALSKRIAAEGKCVHTIELLELVQSITSPGDRLKRLLEKEPSMPRDKMLATMARWTDPKQHLVPAMTQQIEDAKSDVTLVHGCGSVYPFLRTHTILENLQAAMEAKPIVFFFPGEYRHREAAGSDLSLFGQLTYKGYYRAFNLDHYHL